MYFDCAICRSWASTELEGNSSPHDRFLTLCQLLISEGQQSMASTCGLRPRIEMLRTQNVNGPCRVCESTTIESRDAFPREELTN